METSTLVQPENRVAYARQAGGRRPFASPRFYWCVGILLVSAVSMQALAQALGNYFRKEALPLKRQLFALDKTRLAPEYRLYERQPPPLDHETIENLGTQEFLDWMLVDESKKPDDPTRLIRFFVTYYTGKPDMVPHEPRECMQAAGFDRKHEETMTVPLVKLDGSSINIPVAVLDFEEPRKSDQLLKEPRILPVLFFFWANGEYVTTRLGVRNAVANLADKYAYYTKIEISFSDEGRTAWPDRESAKRATAALLRKVMPILWRDHYQDWDAIKAGKPPEVPVP